MIGWPVRVLGWSAVAAVIASVLFGYIAFASFLVDQLVWVALILATLLLAMAFGDEFTTGALGGETRIATVAPGQHGPAPPLAASRSRSWRTASPASC